MLGLSKYLSKMDSVGSASNEFLEILEIAFLGMLLNC